MNRNDILEKSRATKKDEGKEHVKNLTYRYAYLPMCAVAGFFIGANHTIFEEWGIVGAGLGAVILTATAAECFAKYRFNGKKQLAASAVSAAILAVGFCVLYAVLVKR
jgi:hypothetical protein